MEAFTWAIVCLLICAFLTQVAVRLWKRPLYMMAVSQYSGTALRLEKTYVLLVIGGFALVSLYFSITSFVDEFQKWPWR